MLQGMKKICFAFVFFLSHYGFAQTNDFGVWIGAGVKKSFAKHYAIGLSAELRLKENTSTIDNFLTEIDLSRKFGKSVKLSGFYRFAQKNRTDAYEGVNRVGADLSGKISLVKRLKLSYRTRYQWQWDKGQDLQLAKSYWRNRLGFEYKISKKISPYATYEIWYRMTKGEDKKFDRNRLTAGVEYTINKIHSIELYGIYQKELNRKSNDGQTILGLSYRIGI